MARMRAGELEVGPPDLEQRPERRRPAGGGGALERVGEHHEPLPRHLLDQFLAAAEVAIGRRRAHPRGPRRLGEREAERPLLLDQRQRRLDQRLPQVAVVVALARLGIAVDHGSHLAHRDRGE